MLLPTEPSRQPHPLIFMSLMDTLCYGGEIHHYFWQFTPIKFITVFYILFSSSAFFFFFFFIYLFEYTVAFLRTGHVNLLCCFSRALREQCRNSHLKKKIYLFCEYMSTLSLSSDTPEESIRSHYRWL